MNQSRLIDALCQGSLSLQAQMRKRYRLSQTRHSRAGIYVYETTAEPGNAHFPKQARTGKGGVILSITCCLTLPAYVVMSRRERKRNQSNDGHTLKTHDLLSLCPLCRSQRGGKAVGSLVSALNE